MNYIRSYCKRKKILKIMIKKNIKYVDSGKFVFDVNSLYLYKKNKETKHNSKKLFHDKINDKDNFIKFLIKKILSTGRIRIKSSLSRYNATVLMITYNNKTLKMFDFHINSVITKFIEDNEFDKYLENYGFFSDIYKIPQLIEFDFNERIIVEEFVDYEQTSIQSNEVKEKILLLIVEKIIITIRTKNYLLKPFNVIDGVENIGFQNIFIDGFIPQIRIHGDMMYKNIFVKKSEFYFSDFEFSRYDYFLYDFFNYVFTAKEVYGDSFLLENYFNGLYDYALSEVFSSLEICFSEEMRKAYLEIYILCKKQFSRVSNKKPAKVK